MERLTRGSIALFEWFDGTDGHIHVFWVICRSLRLLGARSGRFSGLLLGSLCRSGGSRGDSSGRITHFSSFSNFDRKTIEMNSIQRNSFSAESVSTKCENNSNECFDNELCRSVLVSTQSSLFIWETRTLCGLKQSLDTKNLFSSTRFERFVFWSNNYSLN